MDETLFKLRNTAHFQLVSNYKRPNQSRVKATLIVVFGISKENTIMRPELSVSIETEYISQHTMG